MKGSPAKPSCYAAMLIIKNQKLGGELLKQLQAINPSEMKSGDLLAMHILQNERKWKEQELWK